ncbi:MAG: GAF domain-containing protein, partial [Anaerolineae bacterium]|nr:GAF domain-containing protein [Anaerolineae bacterium]
MSSQTSNQAPKIGATPQPATESAEMAAWRYTRQLTILEAVTRQLDSVEPPEQFLPQILRQLCQSFSYEAALIYRLSPDGRRLLLNPPVEKPVEPNRGWRTEITLADKHIVSDTFRRQTITYLPLTNGVAEAVPPSAHQLHSEICIPMPGGVFHIKSAQPNAFDEVETRFLTSLANLFGTIIKDNQAQGQEQAQPEPVLSGAKQSDLTSDDPSLTVLGYAYDRAEIQTDVALSPAAQQLLTPTDHLAALA